MKHAWMILAIATGFVIAPVESDAQVLQQVQLARPNILVVIADVMKQLQKELLAALREEGDPRTRGDPSVFLKPPSNGKYLRLKADFQKRSRKVQRKAGKTSQAAEK